MTGTVVDAAGMPANGAWVSVVSVAEFNRSGYATVRDGAFSIGGLTPGVYVLGAAIGGQRSGDPNPASREREMTFTELDLTAVDAPNVTLTLSHAVTIRGRVVFEGALPSPSLIGRLVARAYPVDSPAVLFSDPRPSSLVRDDATFELPEIFRLPSIITVQGLPDGWKVKAVRHEGRDVTYAPTDFGASRGPIEVTVTNRLARPVVRVKDAEGQAVTDARVLAVPAAAKAAGMLFGTIDGRPSADGDIKLGPLPAGDYLLVALSLDESNLVFFDRGRFASLAAIGTLVTLKEGRIAADRPAARSSPGEAMTRATLVMLLLLVQPVAPQPGPRSGEDTGQIRGRVTDKETGQPLPNAQVMLMERTLNLNRTGTTDDAGVFRFTGLPPGKYTGVVTAGSYRTSHVIQRLPDSRPPSSIALTKGAVREVNIALSRTPAIPVRVVDEFGDPLSDLNLHAYQAPADAHRRVPDESPDGRSRAHANYRAGTRTLRGVRRHPRYRRVAGGQESCARAAAAHVLSVGCERGRGGTDGGRNRPRRGNRNPHAPRTDLHHFGHRAGRVGRASGRRAGRVVRVRARAQQQWRVGSRRAGWTLSPRPRCVQAPMPSRPGSAGPTGRRSGARAKPHSSRFAWPRATPKTSSSR